MERKVPGILHTLHIKLMSLIHLFSLYNCEYCFIAVTLYNMLNKYIYTYRKQPTL